MVVSRWSPDPGRVTSLRDLDGLSPLLALLAPLRLAEQPFAGTCTAGDAGPETRKAGAVRVPTVGTADCRFAHFCIHTMTPAPVSVPDRPILFRNRSLPDNQGGGGGDPHAGELPGYRAKRVETRCSRPTPKRTQFKKRGVLLNTDW